jgi:hypothetical protein
MTSILGGTPDIPEPKLPPTPKTEDNTIANAAEAERLRRARARGKQQSIFAGELGAPAPLGRATLLGG